MIRQHQQITAGFGRVALAGGFAVLACTAAAYAAELQPDPAQVAATTIGDKAAPGAEDRAPSELAREGMAKMLQALDKLIESVPQYWLPEITENGDIILRRKKPEGEASTPPRNGETAGLI